MPIAPTYPGVYIEEIPSGVRSITGVATSITAFIGSALKGPLNDPTRIQSFADFEREFGGLWEQSTMSYAVEHYFRHGGQDAIIVRVYKKAGDAQNEGKSQISLGALTLQASSPGVWGNALQAKVDHETKDQNNTTLFNLTIRQMRSRGSQEIVAVETLRNLSTAANSPRFYLKVIELESKLVDAVGATLMTRPEASANFVESNQTGNDGVAITDTEVKGSAGNRTGIYALDKVELFNLMCIPPLERGTDVGTDTLGEAVRYCQQRRAMLIVDPPAKWKDVAAAEKGIDELRASLGSEALGRNAAVYFPRLKLGDPLQENRTEEFVPCGAIAGIYARTDASRGVWKAPAGTEAGLIGVRELSYKMTDLENGRLNPKGLNCIRLFRDYGNVAWGARTAAGSDALASEWKYVPVRRTALFIEESLYRGTQWVVFEPNDEPLWAQIRLNVGAFMNNLFRQGAFQGKTPREAYLVKCDKETTTQNDINLGIVNILVGFAPLKPAEFVIIKIQQLAGQIET